jgi:hypothetical protein|tara:strand:+ start:253 stop:510 length:258 start_codon:yes stop_codon:yes gene_type:complete
MVEKNICQNPHCCTYNTKDRWNKKLNAHQSRKAYFNNQHSYRILSYFCTTGCANKWLEDNVENIIERQHSPKKITERLIHQSENN